MKREEREQRLHDFIERYIAHCRTEETPTETALAIDLIAQSPMSPIALALSARLPELAERGFTVKAIFAQTNVDADLVPWFAHAKWVRWARDKRLLDAHEQLVLGLSRCWAGDAMRRHSVKSDLFESLNEGCTETVRLARIAFDRLAALTTPVRSRRVTASLHAAADEKPKLPATGFEGPHPSPDATAERNPLMTRH